MNLPNRLNKRGILFLAGITLILIGVSFAIFSNLIPFHLIINNRKDSSTEIVSDFSLIEGVDCIPDISSYEVGTLIDVIDGDSIRVAIQGSIIEVRYIGIDTPEYNSDQRQAAKEAEEANEKVLSTSSVYLFKDQSETDKYGRLLRYVISNGKFVNLELVRSGHARAKTYFPDTSCQSTFNKVIVK
jgi:endonuclease YncB( thermonuclease family)